jgi:hypothetical protein
MAEIYFNLITHDPPLWEIERVPSAWREAVQAMLERGSADE